MGSDTAAIWDVIEHTILSLFPPALQLGTYGRGSSMNHATCHWHADSVQEQREFAPLYSHGLPTANIQESL